MVGVHDSGRIDALFIRIHRFVIEVFQRLVGVPKIKDGLDIRKLQRIFDCRFHFTGVKLNLTHCLNLVLEFLDFISECFHRLHRLAYAVR